MRVRITPHPFSGTIRVPASKSHTIRRLLIAARAEGVSELEAPLDSLDARSCVTICRALGAEITEYRGQDAASANPPDETGARLLRWTLRGGGSRIGQTVDVGNSGTTLFLGLAFAALGTEEWTFTGDGQIRRRSAGPLLEALRGLGVSVVSAAGGCAPIRVRGPWRGGEVNLPCPTSQYLSALLLAAPLAPAGTCTVIRVPLLNERPYIAMTCSYLKAQGIVYEAAADYSCFRIPGGASYRPLGGPVPGDFSSAAFPLCAAALSGTPLRVLGLDPADTQGDRAILAMLAQMGCRIGWTETEREGPVVELSPERALRGGIFDLNATPDLLPVMAVMACYAQGETRLINVAHARIKETDRIAVMKGELETLGARIEEGPDGLIIHRSALKGGRVQSYGDHRVAMALAVAALGATGPVEIDDAECAAVTYPSFLELLGASLIN